MTKCPDCGNQMVCMHCARQGVTSPAVRKAAKQNGKKGGRPKGSKNQK